jgi:hypothetical protein
MEFSPTSCHFISLRSKYSFQHPVLKHPLSETRTNNNNNRLLSRSVMIATGLMAYVVLEMKISAVLLSVHNCVHVCYLHILLMFCIKTVNKNYTSRDITPCSSLKVN